jgi:nucleotide-binding universal stress UspA family protein
MRVLLTTDGSCGAAAAARTASRVLRSEDRQFDLLCVAPEYRPRRADWHDSQAGRLYRQNILAETQRILAMAEVALKREGVEVEKHAHLGSPQDSIVRASAKYDVTVLGAQGRGVRSEAGLGPVVNHVLQHGAGPILIGRELHSDAGFRVLFAVDGSTASERALDAMTALLDLESAEVILMHVLETPWIHLGLEPEWLRFRDPVHDEIEPEVEWDREFRAEGAQVVEAVRDRLRPFHPATEVELAEGVPAYEILSAAEKRDCDLIVLGATGVTDLKHQLLGSVSYRVAWDAACSVLVVRATD